MKKSQKVQTGILFAIALLLAGNLLYSKNEKAQVRPVVATDYKIAAKKSDLLELSKNRQGKVAKVSLPVGPLTTLEFEETEFDFGTINAGEKVNHVYKFKNTGNEPLVISNAKGSCGCTIPSWSKEPIPVGGTGEIAVQFDSKGKKNKQSKRVTITANTDPAQTFLTIKGEVNVAKELVAVN
jgi:hypothetical protein